MPLIQQQQLFGLRWLDHRVVWATNWNRIVFSGWSSIWFRNGNHEVRASSCHDLKICRWLSIDSGSILPLEGSQCYLPEEYKYFSIQLTTINKLYTILRYFPGQRLLLIAHPSCKSGMYIFRCVFSALRRLIVSLIWLVKCLLSLKKQYAHFLSL